MTNLGEHFVIEPGLRLGLVYPEHIPLVWGAVSKILRDVGMEWLETVSEMEVLAQLANGEWDLWLAEEDGELDGYIICGWEIHANKKRYHVLAIAGKEMNKYLEKYWAKGLERLEQYACLKGADEIVMEGRKGWKRLLIDHGYLEKTARMVKPVKVLWRN